MPKLSIQSLDVQNKEVLMRVDFNVPLKNGAITDDTRITAAVPSIQHLLKGGAKLVLCSHLGRPKSGATAEFSLQPVAVRLAELLGQEVKLAPDSIGEEVAALRAGLQAGQVLLLENTRFYPEEEKNDAAYAKQLAGSAEIFVNDAFGTAHRAHASTEGVTHYAKQSAMGFLMARELEYLVDKLDQAERPFVVIMGGAKVSDKIQVINSLMAKADTFIIGGAMAYTFLKALGHNMGGSRVETDKLDLALEILENAKQRAFDSFFRPTTASRRSSKTVPKRKSPHRMPTAEKSPMVGKASTSARKPSPNSAKKSPRPKRFSGTARWVCLKSVPSPKARARLRRRSRIPRRSRLSVVATR